MPISTGVRIAQVVAAFGVASMTSVCAAYGKAMNNNYLVPDTGSDVADPDANWMLDTTTVREDSWKSDASDARPEIDSGREVDGD